MKIKHQLPKILAILWLTGLPCLAQVQVKVLTKSIEKSFDYTADNSIVVRGEKSKITIKGWPRNQVQVKLKLISKAKNESVARKELEYQKYILEKKKGEIRLGNYYQVPAKEALESILLTEYEIWVPVYANITVDNNYGNINLTNLSGSLKLNNRFGNITLDKISGLGEYQCYFGDFTAHDLDGKNRLKLNKTKTTIVGLSGLLNLDSNLGDVTIGGVNGLVGIDIKGSKSDINFELSPAWKQLSFQFRSEFGEISIPVHLDASAKKTGNVSYWSHNGQSQSQIKVETNFGMINLSER